MDINNKIVIQSMLVSDLDLIAENLENDFDDFWNYNVFKSELENENSKYIVAKINNEIVGFAGIWIAIDVPHITNIVVRKSYRKTGIGSLLLQELIKMCKNLNLKELTLEVNEHNLNAIKLYEKFGFIKVGLRKKYYNRTDNALIMTLYDFKK
ncbi:MAG: ribosomal protein S18-alanine N-acetyltransferase [Clostridia bacterium]|nr:ribosomal protein S18-alanine N-acetyltransferase [Clostridia bacterium]MBR3256006.1 ribosomal protein S18-alanine N-acetyltransferase [Clostridia bacterium]